MLDEAVKIFAAHLCHYHGKEMNKEKFHGKTYGVSYEKNIWRIDFCSKRLALLYESGLDVHGNHHGNPAVE